jgi:hypothetical protein
MFGRRPDGTQVRQLSAMRRFMPFISPRRNDSVFHLSQEVEIDAALEYLEKKNRERPPDKPMTLFHLMLRSGSQALYLRPGVNRFVKGGKLWQRKGEWITFSAKIKIEDGAPLVTIKRKFEPVTETLDEMVDGIYGLIRPARAGRKSTSDKEMGLLLRLPGFVIKSLLGLLDFLDRFGLVPRAMIDSDPLYTSCFVANLGSVGHDAGFHHLWEHGTCSLFGVLGKVRRGEGGKRVVTICWTYDERIEDGLYSYITIAGIKERVEHPEMLELKAPELESR